MPNKKKEETKQEEIPEKIDNQENKPKSINWNELDKYIGKALWDSRNKEWRILEGYKRMKETYSITFTDSADWTSFYDRNLYLEEVKE